MRAVRRPWILVACALVVGCLQTPGHAPATGGGLVGTNLAGGGVSAALSDSAAQADSVGQVDETGFGTVRLTIVWPRRSAAIPLSANSVHVAITDAGGDLKAEKVVTRPPDGQSQEVALKLKAASNLWVAVKAYGKAATSAADLAGETPLAQGNATINVGRSQIATAKITLAPLSAPAITGFSSNIGKVGDTVVIKGSNLSGPSLAVVFNGATASAPVSVSSESIAVAVPETATVGPVRVVVDGISSVSDAVFWVVKSLAITAPRQSWDKTGDGSRLVLATRTLQFSASKAFSFAAGGGTDPGGVPEVEWSSSKAAAGTIDKTAGLYTAADNSQSAVVQASLGSLVSPGIEVTGVVVVRVLLTPDAATLNLPTAAGYTSAGFPTTKQFAAQASFSAPVTIGGVTWKSSDNGKATVGTEGLVTAVAQGTAIVSATSVDDPRVLATATIRVDAAGLVDLVIN